MEETNKDESKGGSGLDKPLAGVATDTQSGHTGIRGCAGRTKRQGRERFCAQQWTVVGSNGKMYCYYHNPRDPKRFGQGYGRF